MGYSPWGLRESDMTYPRNNNKGITKASQNFSLPVAQVPNKRETIIFLKNLYKAYKSLRHKHRDLILF